MRSRIGLALFIFALSLAVRSALFLWVSPLRAAFDEKTYFDRAAAVAEILEERVAGKAPSELALQRFYAEGVWPPLFPLLVGAGLYASPPTGPADTDLARWWVILFGAMTSVVVFFATARLLGKRDCVSPGAGPEARRDPAGPSNRRGALAAGIIHALYPSFIAWAHLLWSETLFILFLLLALLFALLAVEEGERRRALYCSALCGLALGLGALTRAVGVVPMFVVPIWMVFWLREPRRRTLQPLVVLAVAAAILAPWQAMLYAHEGHFVSLSTASGYNLLKLNADFPSKAALRATIADHAEERDLPANRAGRDLAFRAIASDLPRFFSRSLLRFRNLWSFDEFVVRHLLQVHYPALPPAALYAIASALLLSYLALIALAAAGLLRAGVGSPGATLISALLLAGCFVPTVTIGNSRMGLPLLALLVPLAGLGAARVGGRLSRRAAFGVAALVSVNLASIATLPTARAVEERSAGFVSSFYRELSDPSGLLRPAAGATIDCIKLRSSLRDHLEVALEGAAYRFRENRAQRIEWEITQPGSRVLDVVAEELTGPLRLAIHSRARDRTVRFEPIRRENLRRYRPTGLEGIEFRWCGVRSSHKGREF